LVPEEPVATHRDPRYRPRQPYVYRKPQKSAQYLLMERWNKYAHWINIVSAVVFIVLVLDYMIPYKVTKESVQEIVRVTGGAGKYSKNGFKYFLIETESGKSLKVYTLAAGTVGAEFTLQTTRLYQLPMSITSHSNGSTLEMGYIYGGIFFMPLLLFVVAVFGILLRKNITACFNCAIVTSILLIITLVLIF
jgi:hypothetical protein